MSPDNAHEWIKVSRQADVEVYKALNRISEGWLNFEDVEPKALECMQDARVQLKIAILTLDRAIALLEDEVAAADC